MRISLFQSILFGVFGIAALIGLFVFATYTSTGGSNAIGTVVVWGVLPKADINAALVAITQTDQTLKSVTYIEKDPRTLPSDLATAIATGGAPDLVLASQEQLRTLARFITPIPLATLSARTFADSFIQEGGLFAAPGGTGFYGIPLLVDPLVLFSNRAILSSSGIVRPPATWEALTGLVPLVARLTPSQQITRALIALGSYDNVHNARGIISALFLQTGVPISGYSTIGNFAADLGNSAASGEPPGPAVLKFYSQFADPSKVSYTWNASLPDSQQAFLSGDLALYLGYASEARFLRSANPNLDFDVATFPQPATAAAKSTYGLVYALMVPNGAKNPNGAFQAAVLLANSAIPLLVATTGLTPATLSDLTVPPPDPIAALAYAEALYAKGWLSPGREATDGIFSGMISNVISGRSTPETVIPIAENALTSLLQQ